MVGETVGDAVGQAVDGDSVGTAVGRDVVGRRDGDCVGTDVVGLLVGSIVGFCVQLAWKLANAANLVPYLKRTVSAPPLMTRFHSRLSSAFSI